MPTPENDPTKPAETRPAETRAEETKPAEKPVTATRTHRTPATAAPKRKSTAVENAVRTLAPAVPLAVALATGGLGHKTTNHPPTAPQTPTISWSQPVGPPPTMDGCGTTIPCPLASDGHAVQWWFVFKLNAASFPGCGGGTVTCPFGGSAQSYTGGQQYVTAASDSTTLADGLTDCLGTTTKDPVGATFNEVYNGKFHYILWNDQPYGDPAIAACTSSGNCDAPWGHSKGILAWNDDGEGFVMQVSTPSWPASGNLAHPRKSDGNTLGCVKDNDVKLSQHFFALRLTKPDLLLVLKGLQNASVVTDPTNPQVASNGGPSDVQTAVSALGKQSSSETLVEGTLSTGLLFVAKPSDLNVPPFQMMSALLGGVPLRAATFWGSPMIPTTTDDSVPECWSEALGTPGPVQIATSGQWRSTKFALTSGGNHAKLGVSLDASKPYTIFGDENQQGMLSGKCSSSQNGRGGTFYVLNNAEMNQGVGALIAGTTGASAGSQ